MDGLKAQCVHSPGQRPGFPVSSVVTPCKGKSTNTLSLLLPLQGVSFLINSTQGVALGYERHWAFSPPLSAASQQFKQA